MQITETNKEHRLRLWCSGWHMVSRSLSFRLDKSLRLCVQLESAIMDIDGRRPGRPMTGQIYTMAVHGHWRLVKWTAESLEFSGMTGITL